MPVLSHLGHTPEIGEGVFIAPTAHVIGQVRVGTGSNLWFGATVRGDSNRIELGESVSVQECATIHTEGPTLTRVGNRVTLGHHSLVHGAQVGDDCIIGNNASVLTEARVGRFCIIAAHALVPENREIPDYSLVMGVPGKVTRRVSEEEVERILRTNLGYARLCQEYLEEQG